MHIPEHEAPRAPLTPLIDIAFLVLIFFMSLPYKRLDGKLEAHLPTGEGIHEVDKPEPERPIDIRIRARGDGYRFQLGEHVADAPRGLMPVLRQLGPKHKYEIQANAAIPWEQIVRVTDTLAELEFEKVRFHGTMRPTRAVRQARPLPKPR